MQQKKVKILVEGTRARYEKFLPQDAPLDRVELAFCGRGSSNAELLAAEGMPKSSASMPAARWMRR